MALINRRKISLYDEAKAGFSSLLQQTAQVGVGLLVILLLTGGNPPGVIVALSFFGGIVFVAWSEKQRLSQSEQLLEEQQDFSRSVAVEKQQLTQFDLSLEPKLSVDITINNKSEKIFYNKNNAVVTESFEKFLYNKNEIRITSTLLEYKGTEYPIRNISKVKLEKKTADDQSLNGFIILTCLAVAVTLVFNISGLILLASILVLLRIFNPPKVEPAYKLIITITKGEVITLEPKDSDDMKQMRSALEQAIDQLMDECKIEVELSL